MLVIGVYRPFKVELGSTLQEQFDNTIRYIDMKVSEMDKSKNPRILVGGDFNLDFLRVGDNSYAGTQMLNKLGTWAASQGLSQLITNITRYRRVHTGGDIREEKSLLDHLYSNECEEASLINCGTSDHLAIMVRLPSNQQVHTTEKITRRDWRKYNTFNLDLLVEKDKIFKQRMVDADSATDPDTLNEAIANIHRYVMNKLAPERVFRLRAPDQQINSSVEALKKKRDRAYKHYKKTGDAESLHRSQELSKKLKKRLKYVEKKRINIKAKSSNPKIFWDMVSELRGKKARASEITIKTCGGTTTSNPLIVANEFGAFFSNKVMKLSEKTVEENQTEPRIIPELVTIEPVEVAITARSLKSKKSHGIDGIPMCVVKDLEPAMRPLYCKLFQMATTKLPSIWKLARVIPLHKKGEKSDPGNYRPISNLCSLSKLFERIILNKINATGDHDGSHQHGFKAKHSTSTAILEIQQALAERLDSDKDCIVYSLDLSAAFDMLRRKTLVNGLHQDRILDSGLLSIINDFLTDRKCVVEVEGIHSTQFNVDLGCVQGSVLGPKLFNLYTRKIPERLTVNAHITTYADDSYVIINAPNGMLEELCTEAETCLASHIKYLRELGMVVNQDKTEVMFIPSKKASRTVTSISSGTEEIKAIDKMKVLGITMDPNLAWSTHIGLMINKMSRLTGGLKFLRGRLQTEEFLKVLTSQYYGTCYYANQVWLGPHTRKSDLKKLNSMHYKLLRISTNDYKNRTPRSELDNLGRAKPEIWSDYSTCNLAIKVLRDGVPKRLNHHLKKTMYHERRSRLVKFYDDSRIKVGKQAIGNRLKDAFNKISTPITLKESDGTIRKLLKNSFFINNKNIPIVPITVCFNGPGDSANSPDPQKRTTDNI
jgi:hypothetical protein